jgi:hypothetical protein
MTTTVVGGGRAGGREGARARGGRGRRLLTLSVGGGTARGAGGRWTYGRRLHAPTGSCSSVR